MSHDFLIDFIRAHDAAGINAADKLEYWLTHGYVFKTPDYLLIGGEDPDDPDPDTWFVYWAELRPGLRNRSVAFLLAMFLSRMPSFRPKVKFNRGVRGRYDGKIYSTARLRRFISR
jgi:hypothetical protein